MEQLRIWAFTCDTGHETVVLLWCSECGPMGVSGSRDNGMMAAQQHIREHGFECNTEGR